MSADTNRRKKRGTDDAVRVEAVREPIPSTPLVKGGDYYDATSRSDGHVLTDVYRLSDLAWCKSHRKEIEHPEVDPVHATLDVLERVEVAGRWERLFPRLRRHEFAVDVDFEHGEYDPPVHLYTHPARTDAEHARLCCLLTTVERQRIIEAAHSAAGEWK